MKLFSAEKYTGMKICVALSGGADSVCLLHYLHGCAEKYAISLSAIHVEHGIRGETSLRDMRFCEELCAEWGIPLKIVRADVPALAKECGRGIEETGRSVRYDAFYALIEAGECDLVATAHHQNDVAETILFRLVRGTSLSGMKAITEQRGMIRPLLGVSKEQIDAYVKENALRYAEDESNSDDTYARNRIRHTVLPALETVNQGAVAHLADFAMRAAEDDEYLQHLAELEVTLRLGDCLVPATLPAPLFSRACLFAMRTLGIKKDYTCANFDDVYALRNLQSGRKVALPCGVIAVREYENIVFYRPAEDAVERPFEPAEWERGDGTLRADLDSFPEGCVVRTRREGDYIVPFGGSKKTLKKFFTDRKISARLGRKVPLIACGSEILVAVGVEISDKVKIKEETKRVGYFG